MEINVISTVFVLLLQTMVLVNTHVKYRNKKYDIFNAIYQLILFIIFQLVIWTNH